MNDYELIPLREDHLDKVLTWRNRPEVRENMYTNHEISPEEHLKWFKDLQCDKSKQYFIFQSDQQELGVIGFTDINEKSKSASWAFYSGNTSIRGVGSKMEVSALNYAFGQLALNKLNCEVLEFNSKVITFHKKHGFKVEGIFKKHHFANGKYWDVYRLSIFAEDWARTNKNLAEIKDHPFSPGAEFKHPFSISKKQVVTFAKLSGDTNRFHLDTEYSQAHGFKTSLVHGYLSGSIFSKIFGTLFPGEGTIYLKQSMEFLKPIYPEQQLIANVRIETKIGSRVLVTTLVLNNDNEIAIKGEAELILPKDKV